VLSKAFFEEQYSLFNTEKVIIRNVFIHRCFILKSYVIIINGLCWLKNKMFSLYTNILSKEKG